MSFEVLVINPGSTSTKISWFHGLEEKWGETVRHDPEKIATFATTSDQYQFRLDTIEQEVMAKGYNLDDLSTVVGRGGIIDPIPGGTYRVDSFLVDRLRCGRPWDHASNLGGIIAEAIATPRGIPAFIVDPVTVDELDDIARITGLPELPKISLNHALNVKAMIRKASSELGVDWRTKNFIAVHLGGGLTICAHRNGKLIDFNSGNDFGPFSPERAGGLPAGELVEFCFKSGMELKDLKKKLAGKGGAMAYLGTSDMREIGNMVREGNVDASLIQRSMAYQIAGAIGTMAVALSGDVEAIIFTGGISYDSEFVSMIQNRVQWIAPSLIYPGEEEMRALAEGAIRVLNKEEKAKNYSDVQGGLS